HLRIGPKWRQVLPCQQLTTPEQASCRDLATGPELRILNVAAHARIVSVARIRLGPRKSVRAFKGIICDDVSEFESYMPSHAVWSPPSSQPRHGRASSAAFRETNRYGDADVSPRPLHRSPRPRNQATRFGLIFPIGGDVRNHAFGKCNFLDFARHVSQVN